MEMVVEIVLICFMIRFPGGADRKIKLVSVLAVYSTTSRTAFSTNHLVSFVSVRHHYPLSIVILA
jgi:hypothetical protein